MQAFQVELGNEKKNGGSGAGVIEVYDMAVFP